jgi:hypothetical protein
MEFLFVAFALLLHSLFWGAGAAILLLPRRWRRFWPVFATPVGLTLQSLAVWAGAYANLAGTDAYGRASLVLPAVLLFGAARWRPPTRWWSDLVRCAGLGLGMAGCLLALVVPLARSSPELTTISLGSCDAADYAAGARVLMEFARGERGGFLGQVEVVQVMSVDNFFDFWLRLNHFTPSALIAMAGSVFGRAPFELTSLLTAVLAVTVMPVVFWLARAGLRYGSRESLWVAVLYGINPLTWYAVYHVAMGQLLAAQAIGLLTWVGLEIWRRRSQLRAGLGWVGMLFCAYVLILGSYNFIMLVALAPLVAFVGGQTVWTGRWKDFGKWALLVLAPLALAGLVQWERVAGLAERLTLFRTYDFGWAIPGLSPEGWLGLLAEPALSPFDGPVRWLMAAGVVAAVVATLVKTGRVRPARVFLVLSLCVPVLIGYGYLLLRGARLGTNASYDAYKLLSVFYPGVLAALCVWLSPGGDRRMRDVKWAMLALVTGLNLNLAYRFGIRMERPPLIVDQNLAQIRSLEGREDVTSVNLLNSDMWSRLWANGFLLRKPQYFQSHTYEGRLNTALRGDWDLRSGVIKVKLPRPASFQLNPAVSLNSTRSPYFLRPELGEGWYDLEQQPVSFRRWRWMQATAVIKIDNPQPGPLRTRWRIFGIESLGPRDVEFWAEGKKLQSVRVNQRRAGVLLQETMIPPGHSTIELRTPQPLKAAGGGDTRLLGPMIHGIDVEVLP